jgi:GT2 family glycosyltransferase
LTPDPAPLAGVALAISAYRSDEPVIRLLRTAFAPGQPRFAAVIVVDSLGSGAIRAAAEEAGWPLTYVNADRNLGSAGNLDLRLRTAADLGLEWCLTLNHDGELDLAKVRRLVGHGESRARVGAVYPQLIFSSAGGKLDTPRRQFTTYGLLGREPSAASDDEPCIDVVWSSSNGALYRLDAVRDGVTAWPELWMGYEDLAIGWELQRRGWAQLLCRDVPVDDDYEFAPVRLLGREVHLAAKPAWYNYYQQRNLWLIARRTRGAAVGRFSAATRLLVDVALILLCRDRKIERLKLTFRGAWDGMIGRTGKGPVP